MIDNSPIVCRGEEPNFILILLNKKMRKKLSNRACNKLNKTEISYEHADSDISSICSNENIQLPYLIPTMCKSVSEISECSNLSEQACRLSLPKTPQDAFISKSYTPIILAPIAENKCNNDYNNVFIKISDNNMNIENDEWNDCEVIISPKNKKNNINFLHVDDSSSSVSSYDTTDSFENVSYMSDNTVLLMDMNFSKNNLQNSDYSNSVYSPKKRAESVKSNSSNTVIINNININCSHEMIYDQVSCDQLIGCDTIITSPICNILETKNIKNVSDLNSDNLSIVDVDSNYNNNYDNNNNKQFKFK